MPENEKRIEQLDKIVDIIEKILEFNGQIKNDMDLKY